MERKAVENRVRSVGRGGKALRSSFLPFSPPSIGEEEIAEVVETLRSDWISTGPRVERFEREFAALVGSPAALAVSSGTAAIHLALLVAGVGPGDKVVSTPMTFCSTIHAIEHTGARPILVDVEPRTLNIDVSLVGALLESNAEGRREASSGRSPADGKGAPEGLLKAILPVHLYGHPCDLGGLRALAEHHDLALIEDAAHALPARYRGETIGASASGPSLSSPPRLTCFSFYATKNLTTAEGGMLTGDRRHIEEARLWSLHGMSRDAWKRYGAEGSWYYEVLRPGFKYNMGDLQAAIGLQQLRKLDGLHRRRREIARRYDESFSGIPEIETPTEAAGVEHAWHIYLLRLSPERLKITRNRFIEELRLRNIGASVHFIPIHLHPYYRERYGYRPEDFPVALREYRRMLSLPIHPRMADEDVKDVIEAVLDVVASNRR